MSRESVNLKKLAYREIRDRIIRCDYAPGSLLNENQLAALLNTSRTPIREALNHLQEEGLVRILPKKGILVSNISVADISQVFQVRFEVEPIVIRLAGPHLTGDALLRFRDDFLCENEATDILQRLETDMSFHRYLALNCHNKYLLQLIGKVLDENRRITIMTKSGVRVAHSHEEHIGLIDSLLTGDFNASADLMRTHIANCRNSAFHYFLNGSAHQTKSVSQETDVVAV